MKNYRFYLEYASKQAKRKKQDLGTVIAVWYDKSEFAQGAYQSGGQWVRDCISSVIEGNKECLGHSSCSDGYLREKTKRIPESLARTMHPQIFNILDND